MGNQEFKHDKSHISVAAILGAIVSISLLHYLTDLHQHVLHAAYQRLYYVPIIFAAYKFGVKGGLAASIASTAFYLPHIFLQWGMGHHFGDQLCDIAMFNVIGCVTGLFAQKEKEMSRKYKEAYEMLQSSFEKAKNADRLAAIGSLAAAVAHEIRNPINGIKGAQEIVFEKFSPEDKEFKFIGIVRKEMARLEDIVSEILSFARPREPNMRKTDIGAVAASVADMCCNHAAARGVELSGESRPGAIHADADADMIKQALLNLALNGIDACGPGGEVSISVDKEGRQAVIRVRDNGSGVCEANLDKIFEPFFSTKTAGTGLGLAVSRKIIEKHGGEISVKSKEGEGSVFEVRLDAE
jgi:signal transduction histidine kinase